MKKQLTKLLLLLGVFLALGAGSAWAWNDYIYFWGQAYNNWGSGYGLKLVNSTDGQGDYVGFLNSPTGEFLMSWASGSGATSENNKIGYENYNNRTLNLGAQIKLKKNSSAGNCVFGNTSNNLVKLCVYYKNDNEIYLNAYAANTLYLYTNFGNNDWDFSKRISLTRNGTKFTGSVELPNNNSAVFFSESNGNDWSSINGSRYDAGKDCNISGTSTESLNYGNSEKSYTLSSGKYDVEVNLADFSVKFTRTGDAGNTGGNTGGDTGEVDKSTTLYLLHNNTGSWALNGGTQLSYDAKTGDFTGSFEVTKADGANIVFATKRGTNANDWEGIKGGRYVPDAGVLADFTPAFSELGKTYMGNVKKNDDSGSYYLYKGKYEFIVNLQKKTITIVGENVQKPKDEDLYIYTYTNGNWGTSYKMDHVDGSNIWTITSDKAFASTWRIAPNGHAWNYGMDSSISPRTENNSWYNASATFTAIPGKVTLKFTLIPASKNQGSSVQSYVYYTVEQTGINSVSLYGDYGNASKWDANKATPLKNENGKWIIENVKMTKTDNYFKFIVNGDQWAPGSNNVDVTYINPYDLNKGRADGAYKIGKGTYDISVEFTADNKAIVTIYPESMYLYGNIKDGSWVASNYQELTKVAFGKYECKSVLIKGAWNDYDYSTDFSDGKNGDGSQRTEWGDTKGLNYVAFYPAINTKADFAKNSGNVWKFGTFPPENDYNNNANRLVQCKEYGTPINTKWEKENQANNFVVAPGYYKVSFDLENGTATFDAPEETPETTTYYNWFYGDDDNGANAGATRLYSVNTYEDYKQYEFTTSLKRKVKANVVQVGLFEYTLHHAARQVKYTVGYRPFDKNGAKRRVGDIDQFTTEGLDVTYQHVTTNKATGEKTYGGIYTNPDYTGSAVSGTNVGHYTVIGSDDYSDNHLLVLNKEGQYYITAELADDAQGIEDGLTVKPSAILVNVTSGEITGVFNVGTDNVNAIKPWLMTGNDFKKFLTIKSDELSEADIKVTFTPTGDVDQTPQPDTRPETFNPYVWGQMIGIQKAGYNVDGYYDAAVFTKEDNYELTGEEGANSTYDISIHQQFPCSGKYTVSAQLTDATLISEGYSLNVTPATVTIYPTILNVMPTIEVTLDDKGEPKYSTQANHASSYSIFDSYPQYVETNKFTSTIIGDLVPDNARNIQYGSTTYTEAQLPKAYASFANTNVLCYFWNLDNAIFYTPGVYLAANTSTATLEGGNVGSEELSGKKNANVIPSDFCRLDLSGLENPATHTSNSQSYNVNVILTKNGASTLLTSDGKSTEAFTVTSTTNAPTGVETIGTEEEGEAVYYNLQGVRVENPEKGLYIKVVNGKSTKVMF